MARTAPLPRLFVCALLALFAALYAPALPAQPRPPTASADAGAPAESDAAPDSPRASIRQYVELCRAGEYDEAARYLDVPPGKTVDGAGLARRLKSVLDRHLWNDVDLALLASPFSSGNTHDKLPPGVDELGSIPGARGPEPVRVVRRAVGQTTTWVFSRTTVDRIDIWYARLEEKWLFEKLPEPLLRPGPFDILYWQYIALPLFLMIAWASGKLFGFLTRKLITKLVARTNSRWDDTLVSRMGPPLTLAWGLGAFALLVPKLGLYEPARDTVQKVIRAGFLVAMFWAVMRAIDVAKGFAIEAAAPGRASARSLIPLGAQVIRLLVLSTAAVMVLSELGYPVASLIAGLGIGGIAIALSAQKTVENLFGSLSIGVDQPFRIGDFVKVEDVTGTVESVGLRSTRIRTPDRTVVTIPNGKLADLRIECFAVRDRYRLATVLPLVYGTTSAQIRRLLTEIEEALRAEDTLFKEGVTVAMKGLSSSAIDIEVVAWFEAESWDAFVAVRQRMLLLFLELVEKNGSRLAYPTQTVRVVRDGEPAEAAAAEGADDGKR